MKKYIIALIAGIVLFSLGAYQFIQYEENSLTVTATISDIETVETDDGYRYTYYVDYTVDGEQYTHKKYETRYSDSMFPDPHVGDTVEMKVSPDHPGRKMTEGGIFGVAGLLLALYGGISLCRNKKRKNNPTAA